MTDILDVLAQLSKMFQHDHFLHSDVEDYIENTLRALRTAYLSPQSPMGPKLSDFLSDARQQMRAEGAAFDGNFEAYDLHFFVTTGELDRMKGLAQKFITSLVSSLEERFPNMPLLSAFDVFDPQLLNRDGTDALPLQYGMDKLATLADHYCTDRNGRLAMVNRDRLRAEWPIVSEWLFQNRHKTMLECWRPVLQEDGQLYPATFKLVVVALLLPTNTACCERGFSAVNRIKNFMRNRMKTPLLNACMVVRLNGPSLSDKNAVDVLVAAAFETWNDIKRRLPQRGTRHERPRQMKKVQSLMELLETMQATHDAEQQHEQQAEEGDDMHVGHFDLPQAAAQDGLIVEHEQPALTPVDLNNQFIAVKWSDEWHIGKVQSHSVKDNKSWVVYLAKYAHKGASEDTLRACRRKLQYSHFLGELQYGERGQWLMLKHGYDVDE
jgi:hypothetical protein